jgi:dUTP pyrophosphatase
MHLKIKILASDIDEEFIAYYESLRESKEDAGMDILFPRDEIIPANVLGHKIRMGISVEPTFSDGTLGFFVMPRSSMGLRTPLRQSNSIGLIDKGYRGEIMCLVDNRSDQNVEIKKNTRLFQIVDPSCRGITCSIVESLDDSVRGEGGFGSTGQ